MAFGVFLSGFVIDEPAPYELFLVGLIGLWALFGLRISRTVAPLLILLIVFNIGGLIALTRMNDLEGAPLYIAVSVFLALTSVFFAAIIEDDERRLRLIFGAYIAAALVTAMLGILGYFGAIPGGERFTLYDRARGAFGDPNVFGPYLILPSLILMHGILNGRLAVAPFRLLALLILSFGIFLSFSRAAWGATALSMMLLVFVMLVSQRSGIFRLRVLVMALIGLLVLIAALIFALQFDAVSELFTVRAQLVQDYDGARFGRFERHKLGFLLAMEKPLGIGPLAFGPIYGEDTHNIWLKALLDYGWLGFVAYLALIVWTLVLGFRYLLRERSWQPYLMTAYIVFVAHVIVGTVIDTDHWRHFYLILGVLWGCFALERRHQREAQLVRRRPSIMGTSAVRMNNRIT
ncbi:O-antigen ligase family protein [Pararhizobium haloflavum]|uniref:O-antigen ligase family protein n=1 Tax=Pararhizobium haloflavum TaxID=2037914 RepID=UPI00351F9B83